MKVLVQTNIAELHRLSRHQTYIAVALIIAMRGTCRRAQVGCVITQDHRIVSTGYNGPLQDNHCMDCDITQKCYHAVHAEANAIAFAAKQGVSLANGILYCTHSPCYECAKLIVQAGIIAVYFNEPYLGKNPGHELLAENGVTCEPLKG